MYAETDTWKAYQPFLPSALRCEGDREPQEEYWAWRGHDVHLDRHPNERAPVKLIALHGGGGNGRLMAPVGVAAQEVAETVAPDLPGYGHTRLPGDRAYTYTDWVDCVAALIEAERDRDDRPIVLLGASIGGMLAYDAAARSDAVRGVIATCLLEPRDPEVRHAVVRHPVLRHAIPALLAAPAAFGKVRIPIRFLANVRAIANDPGLAAACLDDPVGGGNSVPISFMASWLRSERPVAPEHFRTPVLLTHPGDDRWTPAHLSRSFLERIAAPTTYIELANCGHFPIEEPGISMMNTSVTSFIRTLLDDTTSTK